MMNFFRGGQKGMIGFFVNIFVDIESVCLLFFRIFEEFGIIFLKLKRKLVYKGYYIY